MFLNVLSYCWLNLFVSMVIGIAMKIKLKALCIFAVTAFGALGAKGQDAAVKTNLLYDAALTVNLGVEFGLAPRRERTVQRMDAFARSPVETLAFATRGALLVLRPFLGPLSGGPCAWRPV